MRATGYGLFASYCKLAPDAVSRALITPTGTHSVESNEISPTKVDKEIKPGQHAQTKTNRKTQWNLIAEDARTECFHWSKENTSF
ncbi:hypothetical protein Tcan_11186 [Toxocara canis]|uniref:Uncharacterized protein n=1 Tax=Toxocara canis TaxID=6265 RepID=A0A0B2W0A5_TOXCA|nr:hypothetical protein Tcan_11186 [Toxocara canis]